MHRVVAVQPLDSCRVRIRFADGVEGVVDLSDLAGKGVFAAWADPREFAKAFIDPETHTIAWPGGLDLAPEALYEDIVVTQARH